MTHLRAECLAVHGFYPRVACLYFDGSNSETSGSLLFVALLTSCHAMNSSNCEGVNGAFFKIVGFACKRFLLSLPLPRHALFCARPNFRAAKKRKMPRTCGKPYGNACYAGYLYSDKARCFNQSERALYRNFIIKWYVFFLLQVIT